MFRGSSSITLDTKGRLTMPTRYRDELLSECDGEMVCTIDTKLSCLFLYPLHEWEIIERSLKGLSNMNPAHRRLQRLLLGNADDCTMDKNGRLLISPTLRRHAGLEKKIMLVGQLNKFEIWSEDTWYSQVQADIDYDDSEDCLSDELIGFSL